MRRFHQSCLRRLPAAPAGLQLSPVLNLYIRSMPNPRNASELAAVARFHLLPDAYIRGLANTKKTEWEYTSYFFGKSIAMDLGNTFL